MIRAGIQDHPTDYVSRITGWLTVERVGYGLAVLLALSVRLWDLSATSLSPTEALQALPAVTAVNGVQPDLSGVSPLLHALQRILFTLFGASDATARFWPALLGGFSPALFSLLRSYLTPGGALAGAFMWALSPLGVWSSRLSLGDALVPALALALLGATVGQGEGRRWGAALGLVFGLLLTSGPNTYTILLAMVAAALWSGTEARRLWSSIRGEVRLVLAGLLIALLIATSFLTEPAGLAAGAGLLGQWVSDLIPGPGEYSAAEIFARLLLNEPFALAFGLAGAIRSLRRRQSMGSWLGMATMLAFAVALIGRGRQPVDLSLVALGLTLLAAPVVARAAGQICEWRSERDAWLLVLVSLSLLIASAFSLPGAFNAANSEEWRVLYAGVGIATLVMSLFVWVVYGVLGNWRTVAQALPVVPLVLGLAWQVRSMVSLSYDHGAWRRAAIVHDLPASDLVDLQSELHNLSALNRGGAREAVVDVAWPSLVSDPVVPLLRWQLRDFPYARFSASIPSDAAPLVLTPVEEQPRLNGYSGAEFPVLKRWTMAKLPDFTSALRWVLYREALAPPDETRLILWVDKTQK